jgi:radical SAM superfamily enzyme YgiQ (UPF0313 family)
MPVSEAADRLEDCAVVGFSIYVWNVNLSMAIAAELKRRNPEVIIIVGGPQVPDRIGSFMDDHPAVDVACHGEGEITFTELLDALPSGDFAQVGSITYRCSDGALATTPRRERLGDLDVVPSPYLDGVFDELLEARPGEWVMTWETNRGCPFSCTFCDWGSATAAKVYRFGMERLTDEIAWMANERVGFVICCDANFGMLPRDLEIAQAIADSKRATGFPWSLSVQNTKNARERAYQVQTLIAAELNTIGVTISLQSANKETLVNIKRRNISTDAYEDLQHRFARDGVYTYTDLILGLPGDTYESFADSVSHVVRSGQHNHVQFHNCSILPNAEMAEPAYREKFGLEAVSQRMTNTWDPIDRVEEVSEYLDTVVATASMPPADWERTKVFSWMTDLLYFDRLLQVPLAVLCARHDLALRGFVEAFIDADSNDYPVTALRVAEMRAQANQISSGGLEQRGRAEYGGVYMPEDQYALAALVFEGALRAFYVEADLIIREHLNHHDIDESPLLIGDLLDYNEATFMSPATATSKLLVLSHPVDDLYKSVVSGGPATVEERWAVYSVDRVTRPVETFLDYLGHLAWSHDKDKREYLASVSPARLVAPVVK